MVNNPPKRKNRRQSLQQILLVIAILICVNILSRFVFTRLDFTQEKRYTLSNASVQLSKNLNDVVSFKIYLEGDLPPGFNRLKNSLKEMLDEFRVYAGDNLEYEFIDPAANPDEKARMQLFRQLAEKGLIPTNLEQKDQSGKSQKIIFPGAIVSYRSKLFPFQILKSRMGSSPEEMLNISIENLEYEICSMLRRITVERVFNVGFLKGQNEISTDHLSDANAALSEFYRVDTVEINGQLNALKDIKVLIIAGPNSAFDEKDKFIIDQFIMNGGKVFWLIDKMNINMDSLVVSSTNVAIPNELNIDDMLFKYGVRINADLLLDLQAAPIPIITGYVGNQPKQQLFPWYYFPLLQTENLHPIVHNLNSVKGEFVSSVDTIESGNVRKTVLLNTSKFSRLQMAPARVSLNMLRDEPDPKLFSKHFIPAAVLLEGIFESNYVKRIPESLANSPEIGFKDKSTETSMIIAGDGNIISNYVSKKGNVYMLGYDRFTGQTYGNRNFILNCIDYLAGNRDILSLRGKEFRLRLLDPSKTENANLIQWTNMLLPAALIVMFGLIFNYVRKKKYSK